VDKQQHTPNHLINEKSPYLLQHTHNPVDWYPWGGEALEKAKREDKPVFLSIGYSTCHWCHVMAEQSFEDQEVAERLNRDFVSVKVDKEERPDIDNVYMRVCQAMTGNGGWPTSIFMNGEGRPFYAGTYFPRPHFLTLLEAIGQAWKQDRETLFKNSGRLMAALKQERRFQSAPAEQLIGEAVADFQQRFDPEWGGFGRAPKFPSPHNLMFLLYTAPELAEQTLVHMYRGGVFDHVGGGFCRYSTDRQWLAPHFEKMLYDNALLVMAYALAYEMTGRDLYRTVIRRVLAYLEQEMQEPQGGFFSAQDADAEGIEGKYYLFSKAELIQVLGREDGELFCRAYGISEQGNFEGQNIPNLLHDPEPDPAAAALLPRVYAYRRSRMRLGTDHKILTGWNALAAAAFAWAGRVLEDRDYLRQAARLLALLRDRLGEGDRLFSGETDGQRLGPGFLDDYAYTIFALLQMYQATLDDSYVERAARLTRAVRELFGDREGGGFFFSGAENERLLLRPKESYDNALPSGNSVMADNLSRLAFLTNDPELAQAAEQQRDYMDGQAAPYPSAFAFYLYSLLPKREIVCAVRDPAELGGLKLRSHWLLRQGDPAEYPPVNDRTTYYVCEDGACRPPVHHLA